jgi:hypothetical protein
MKIALLLIGLSAAIVLAAVKSTTVNATPAYTQQTGKGCSTCHTTPPALNETGRKFKENGHKF